MDLEHHRSLAAQAGCPEVHLQHVLADPAIGPLIKKRLFRRPAMQTLRELRPVDQRRQLTVPRCRRLGRQPPVLAAGVRALRNASKGQDAVIDIPAHLAVLCLRHRSPRCGATGTPRRNRFRGRPGRCRRRCRHTCASRQHGLTAIESETVLRFGFRHFFSPLCICVYLRAALGLP